MAMPRYPLRSHVKKPEKVAATKPEVTKKPKTSKKKPPVTTKKYSKKKPQGKTRNAPKAPPKIIPEPPSPDSGDSVYTNVSSSTEMGFQSSQDSSISKSSSEDSATFYSKALSGFNLKFKPDKNIEIPKNLTVDQVFSLDRFYPLPPQHVTPLPKLPSNLFLELEKKSASSTSSGSRASLKRSRLASPSSQSPRPRQNKTQISSKKLKLPTKKVNNKYSISYKNSKKKTSKPISFENDHSVSSGPAASEEDPSSSECPTSRRPQQSQNVLAVDNDFQTSNLIETVAPPGSLPNSGSPTHASAHRVLASIGMNTTFECKDLEAFLVSGHHLSGTTVQTEVPNTEVPSCSMYTQTDFPYGEDEEFDELLYQDDQQTQEYPIKSSVGAQTTFDYNECDTVLIEDEPNDPLPGASSYQAFNLKECWVVLDDVATQTSFPDEEALFLESMMNGSCMSPQDIVNSRQGHTSKHYSRNTKETLPKNISGGHRGIPFSSNLDPRANRNTHSHESFARNKIPRKSLAKKILFKNEAVEDLETLPQTKRSNCQDQSTIVETRDFASQPMARMRIKVSISNKAWSKDLKKRKKDRSITGEQASKAADQEESDPSMQAEQTTIRTGRRRKLWDPTIDRLPTPTNSPDLPWRMSRTSTCASAARLDFSF